MKKLTSKITFHWVHKGGEEYDFGEAPIEVSDDAYEHLLKVYGSSFFTVETAVENSPPVQTPETTPPADNSSPAETSQSEPKKKGRPKKTTA